MFFRLLQKFSNSCFIFKVVYVLFSKDGKKNQEDKNQEKKKRELEKKNRKFKKLKCGKVKKEIAALTIVKNNQLCNVQEVKDYS